MEAVNEKNIQNNNGALRPDAQAFDEIRLYTVPRYKTSGMSGDEWRISTMAEFKRNGIVKHEEMIACDMDHAVAMLGYKFHRACDDGKAYFASEDGRCDQEGCYRIATNLLKKKFDFCQQGHKTEIKFNVKIRQFCDEHKERGDCGLDDADNNYDVITGL